MQHALKCWPQYFAPIASGSKTFDVRKNDRPFKAGDTILLREYDPKLQELTGLMVELRILYVLDNPEFCIPDHVILAISLMPCNALGETFLRDIHAGLMENLPAKERCSFESFVESEGSDNRKQAYKTAAWMMKKGWTKLDVIGL